MESLRSLIFRITTHLFQVSVLLSWCLYNQWQENIWLWGATLVSATGGLIMAFRYVPRAYRHLMSKWQRNLQPSKEIQAERKRIASDLHDTLGSQLVQALVLMEGAGNMGSNPAKDVLEQSLLDLRLIVDSMDAQDDSLTLRMARLRHRLEPVMKRKGMVLHWSLSDPELGIGRRTDAALPIGKVAYQILAVVQESISNSIEHSHASEVWVTLEPFEKDDLERFGWQWRICVEDNGVGFNPKVTLTDSSKLGHGISNMYRRMSDIGGDIHIQPRPGGGTQVFLRWREQRQLAI